MKAFLALLSRITATLILSAAALLFAVWVVVFILALVVLLAAAVVCAAPMVIGVQFQNWAARLEGKEPMQVGDSLARFNDIFDIRSRLN